MLSSPDQSGQYRTGVDVHTDPTLPPHILAELDGRRASLRADLEYAAASGDVYRCDRLSSALALLMMEGVI